MIYSVKRLLLICLLVGVFIAGWVGNTYLNLRTNLTMPILAPREKQLPYLAYSIENLANHTNNNGLFQIISELFSDDAYTSYLFNFRFSPDPQSTNTKMVSGQINIPKVEGTSKFPVILMLRGYVDQNSYTTGDGTRSAAAYFAQKGYVTVAPDFLGYGESDSEAGNIFETRFQTYTTVLSLLSSVDTIEAWDKHHVYIWAHSNGGQIALTLLEISGKAYPTTLWAPVTKPFPYSVLYYTDESEDGGKLIRHELAKFENYYDTDLYSIHNYFERINAPIQLHQGSGDDAVPINWSNSFVKTLTRLDKDITYFTYPGADHNLRPDWETVITRDIEFFQSHK